MSNEVIATHLNQSKRTVENNIYKAEKVKQRFLQENQLALKSLAFILVCEKQFRF